MDINEGTAIEDLWSPFKELVSVVEGYLAHESGGAPYAVHTFESVLRRHKQTFLSLLKNPAKNPTSREEIKRGMTEGVNLPSIGRTLLAKELVDEAIIISDMYNVHEYLALELLHSAARATPRHPGLPRGLVAVLLYYDGARARAQALRELALARDGVSWSINAREEIVTYVSRYMDQLIADGLLGNILDTLQRFTLGSELELLQANRAIPPGKHHVQLVSCIRTTRKLFAQVVFAASAQRGLGRDILLRLLSEQSLSPTRDASGCLDEISLALQMALLYALDLSVLHRREDGEELAKKLPLIQDPELIPVLVEQLSPGGGGGVTGGAGGAGGAGGGGGGGLRALCQLSLGLALASLKRAPHQLHRSPLLKIDLLDQDEVLVDAAIDARVFEYLDEAVLSSGHVAGEEYYQRRVHTLLTDFIVLMHSKLMEMRVKADEAGRTGLLYLQAGLAAPGPAPGPAPGAAPARTRLDALLRCVSRLYATDPHRLRDDYWKAQEHEHASYRSGGRAHTLYKFVRLSGSLGSAALLPLYLRALAALAVPTHTWQLLTAKDARAAHHLLTAAHNYYYSLRQEPSPLSAPPLGLALGAAALAPSTARIGKLLVRQEEVEAMIAAFKLIEAVAKVDEAACSSICENLQWDAVNCMFGLICCHVPLALKAQLCRSLGALAAAAPARVWAALEAHQLVGRHQRGLQAELLHVECRMEQYPLTRAMLSLLEALCGAAPAPRALGAGARCPGLGPYLHYTLHVVALPAPLRPYARPAERWEVLASCFSLFSGWLEQYTPSAGDWGEAGQAEPPPGLPLLLQLHTKSELLRLLLSTLDDALALLDAEPGDGREAVESCLISVLCILERGLALERALQAAASEAGRPVVLVSLSKLILAGEGGGLAAWLRAVGAGGRVARRAVALLCRAAAAPALARQLLPAATPSAHMATLIRHGFVECLEAEEWGGEAEEARQAKEGVIVLLLQLLPTAAPNFAHFLLGYQHTDDISLSTLNEAGVAGYPRTCFHSILDILDQFVASHNADKEATTLVESCYRVLYSICSRPATSPPALRLLSARDPFLLTHLNCHVNLETASVTTISARSWLLRTCAAHSAARAAQHSSLLAALAAPPPHPQEWEWCLIRRLLEGLVVSVETKEEPRWELFHRAQLAQARAACDTTTAFGGKRISVSRLHAVLQRELAALHASQPQRNLVQQEIQKVLDYATEINRQRNLAATLTHYYDSWRQLTEILFCVAPQDLLSLESRKNLLLNILQDLLNKIPPAEVLPQIGNLASGTVLLLLVNLRHCYVLQKRESNLKSADFETTFFGPSNQILQTNSLTLKFILHKILSWILVSGGSTQKMRVNLYGALLNFLNIVNLKTSPADSEDEEENNDTYVSRLDSSRSKSHREESSLKSMVIDVISGFGDNLCSIVCSDCIGAGHDVCRMVALSCLDTLIEINPRTDWMNTLTNQGYLRSLIDGLLQDDEGLKQALEPNPKSLRVLYVYESKMALLIKIAGTRLGAETVLAQGALSCLANMKVLDCHPDIHTGYGTHQDTEFVPSIANRFRQILVPALSLCDALLSTLGSENHSCVLHVLHALLTHIECVDVILRAAHPNSPRGLLIELEAITSVVGRASNQQVLQHVQADSALHSCAVNLQRVQALMLALIPRFKNKPQAELNDEDSPRHYKIVCNLLTYACNISSRGGAVVGPEVSEAAEGPQLGAVLQLLQNAALHRAQADKHRASARQQLQGLPALTLQDMQKLSREVSWQSPAAGRAGLARELAARARARARELHYTQHAAERALYLVWLHVRLYLAAAHTDTSLSATGAWRGAGGDSLQDLRKGLVAVFNDRFTDQLLEATKSQPPAHKGFIEILVKDIKGMLQFSQL